MILVKHSKVSAIADDPSAVAAGEVVPSDWNADHAITGLGTAAEHDVEFFATAAQGAKADTALQTVSWASPSAIGSTTPAAGTFTTLTATGQTSLGGAAGANNFRVLDTAGSVNYWNVRGGDGSTTSPRFATDGTGTNIAGQFASKGTGAFQFLTGGTREQLRVTDTSSAVNYVQVTGAATGSGVAISAQGSDSNIGLELSAKGTSSINFRSGSSAVFQAIMNTGGDSWLAANRMTGNANLTASSAAASNVALSLQSKGTGAIDLAAGSKGVNISNGGTVTAITRTAGGSGYTGVISATVSAPTTAGGATATAQAYTGAITAAVQSGGTGYTVGNTLTLVGGTGIASQTLIVSTVSGGVITAVTVGSYGQYTVLPANPVSVTGGTGSGATFNLSNFSLISATITNAGSGYVEQPTVTFSGGGGSGAAAYATVGSTPKIQTLGSNLSFYTPGGEQFRIAETTSGLTAVNFIQTSGNSAGAAPRFLGVGADANVGIVFSSKGTGELSFRTNGTNQTQLLVSHTASAVNYVQVTGGVTGGAATVQFTGSDANVLAGYFTKGSGSHSFYSAAGASRQVRIDGGNASAVNYLDFYGASAGSAPSVRVNGSDTNIDLTLTPKGTGNVRFGTLTASADAPITGYITIKDSGGTVRKLAVIA